MQEIGRMIVCLGLILVAVGGLLLLAGRVPWIGRLPGDLLIQRRNVTFYFPLATSILLSFLFSLVLWLLSRR